ncbi:MAG: hypothetical protein R6W48_09720 [Gaiellaceae bacterium]
MADAPWQCLQCGTINEPVANSCRSCGRWPSLFDLERGTLPGSDASAEDETWARRAPPATVEVEEFEPQTYENHGLDLEPMDAEPVASEPIFDADDEEAQPSSRGRLVRSLIVPIAFGIYILISIIFGDRGQ